MTMKKLVPSTSPTSKTSVSEERTWKASKARTASSPRAESQKKLKMPTFCSTPGKPFLMKRATLYISRIRPIPSSKT